MIKMIRFTSELDWEDGYTPMYSHLELPYIEGMDLDGLVWKVNYEDYMSFSKAFIPLYPDKVAEIESFDNCGSISYEMFGYEERDDMLTSIKPYTKPKRKDGGIYLSCRRSARIYDVAPDGTVAIQSHIVSETYTRYKLNFDFTWSYEGEPYEEHVRYSDGDFKSHFNVT